MVVLKMTSKIGGAIHAACYRAGSRASRFFIGVRNRQLPDGLGASANLLLDTDDSDLDTRVGVLGTEATEAGDVPLVNGTAVLDVYCEDRLGDLKGNLYVTLDAKGRVLYCGNNYGDAHHAALEAQVAAVKMGAA